MNDSSSASLALLLLFGLAACSDQRPVPPLDLAQVPVPIAAEFRTIVESPQGATSSTDWRFWRTSDRIERENPAAQTGDIWVRDGKAMFHSRLYHADRRAIEYRTDDLQMLQAAPQWVALSTLLDPQLLAALRERDYGWQEGYPYRRYAGEVAGVHWDITVRTDRSLPVRIERRDASGQVETVELLSSFAHEQAPWQLPMSADYDTIDFADLGDHERDPFVMRIQAEESGGHLHGHAH